ncbi:MAG TPA: hypothetical protein PLQ13_05515, partial [Candidatus Krumholzibacteria bacterium]|nr:hypothetical protein [Candidatus Krumholzibacteria bacterium]
MKIARIATLVLAALLAASAAQAVTLRFAPQDTVIAVGETGRLSVMIDEPITIRTIDVTVAFDTTYVTSLGGGAGTLYTTSGYQLFRGFEMLEPGVWHGYSIVLGAGLSLVGPGE